MEIFYFYGFFVFRLFRFFIGCGLFLFWFFHLDFSSPSIVKLSISSIMGWEMFIWWISSFIFYF
jgi:hypothetical protein